MVGTVLHYPMKVAIAISRATRLRENAREDRADVFRNAPCREKLPSSAFTCRSQCWTMRVGHAIAEEEGIRNPYVCWLLPLTCVAPDIVEAIL